MFVTVNFGKYKNRPVSDLLEDKDYCSYLLEKSNTVDFFKDVVRRYKIKGDVIKVDNQNVFIPSFNDTEPVYITKEIKVNENSYYYKKFMERLEQESVPPEETNIPYKDQWIYAGGEGGRHCLKLKSIVGNETYEEIQLILGRKDHCICTHEIEENCYILNIISKKILVVGNCCIKRYLNIDTSKRCEECKLPHRNFKDNFCKDCRGGIFDFGKHEGKTFAYVRKNDTSYCDWVITKCTNGRPMMFKEYLISKGYGLKVDKV